MSTGYVVPVILTTVIVSFAVSGIARPLVLSALYALWAAGLAAHAARQNSFEHILR